MLYSQRGGTAASTHRSLVAAEKGGGRKMWPRSNTLSSGQNVGPRARYENEAAGASTTASPRTPFTLDATET